MSQSRFYLILFALGIILPAFFLISSLVDIGWDMEIATQELRPFFASALGRISLVWMLVSGIALTAFISSEALVRRDYYLFWALPILLVFGIGAALPFYLFLRSPREK